MKIDFWRGKRVLVTGHTGFKGGWLCLWLGSMGAEVHGLSLQPPLDPNLFTLAGVRQSLATDHLVDLRDYEHVAATLANVRPEIVFHLAAQPLVRYSYQHPVATYGTNVMGTVHLLEAIRAVSAVKAIVVVTSDKCYENREWVWGYRENEPMGGYDPYSSSKGCAEIVAAAYRSSYFSQTGASIATARAGNVIGGGDWGAERLFTDIMSAIDTRNPLHIRSPQATRPWQHVLEPLSGYLLLARRLYEEGARYAEAWNFGPEDGAAQTVRWIVEYIAARIPDMAWESDEAAHPHEAHYLKLDSSKAQARLGWHPCWDLPMAIDTTIAWHKAWQSGLDMRTFSLQQINAYLKAAREQHYEAV